MHVTHFEACALTGQTTRAKGRYTALVRDFGQGVGLVHELRELRRTKELFQGRGNRLAIDEVMGHQRLLLGLAQALFDRFFNPRQTGAVLVFCQLTNAAYAAIAKVVDVIDITTAIAQVHQNLDHGQDVFVGQHHGTGRLGAAHFGVELHASDPRQIVGVRVVEQTLEQRLHRVFGRRLAGSHHAVDRHPCCEFVGRLIGP